MMINQYLIKTLNCFFTIILLTPFSCAYSKPLPDLIKNIKPSIVGIGTHQGSRRPPSRLSGTGFVVSNGQYVITNHHVLPKNINLDKREKLVVFYNKNKKVHYNSVKIIDVDRQHDLALLKIIGKKLPALSIVQSKDPQEGEEIFFTGFPIGAVLGLFPVTHRGIISAISPVGIPVPSSSQLTSKMINHLKNAYEVYQLDATAYPGNSGSPLFSLKTGKVIGVINKASFEHHPHLCYSR